MQAKSLIAPESNTPSPAGTSWRAPLFASREATEIFEGLDRAARQPTLIDAPADLTTRLESAVIAVVGAGSIGQRIVDALARMGVGALWICDPAETKPESLLTHPISPGQVGESKARLAARHAIEIAPGARVRFFDGEFEAMPMNALVGATHVIVATDRLAPEVAISQACLRLGVPLLQASVYGAALVAQVRTLPADSDGAGPCLCCHYLARDWRDLDAATRFSCDGHAESLPDPRQASTMSLPHLCSVAADLAIGEWLRLLLGLDVIGGPGRGGAPSPASSLAYCGFHGGTTRTPLARNPECPLEHARWSRHLVEHAITNLSPSDLARFAGSEDLREVSIRVEGFCFASHLACDCPTHPRLERFHPEAEKLSRPCADCGATPVLHPLHSHIDVPGSAFAGVAQCSLAELGVRGEPPVLVRGPTGSTLVHPAPIDPFLQANAHPSEARDARREEMR